MENGRIVYIAITQNKPKDLVDDIDTAAAKLLAGQRATVDVRWNYISELRKRVEHDYP